MLALKPFLGARFAATPVKTFVLLSAKQKKAMVSVHSLLGTPSASNAEIKRPWEPLKSAMAFNSNSNAYNGAGQTFPSLFCQHHQFILFGCFISSAMFTFNALRIF